MNQYLERMATDRETILLDLGKMAVLVRDVLHHLEEIESIRFQVALKLTNLKIKQGE